MSTQEVVNELVEGFLNRSTDRVVTENTMRATMMAASTSPAAKAALAHALAHTEVFIGQDLRLTAAEVAS